MIKDHWTHFSVWAFEKDLFRLLRLFFYQKENKVKIPKAKLSNYFVSLGKVYVVKFTWRGKNWEMFLRFKSFAYIIQYDFKKTIRKKYVLNREINT